jgi:3'-5' exoribonuclease
MGPFPLAAMDKKTYVMDIRREEEEVADFFVVLKKAILSSKNNTRYVSVLLKDRTGTIEGRIWEGIDELSGLFEKNDVVHVKAKAKVFEKGLQLTIYDIRRVEEELGLSDMGVFYGESRKGVERLKEEYFGLLSSIRDPSLLSLLQALAQRKKDMERFCLLPASISLHHVFVGGLLEHSLSLAKIGSYVAGEKGANREIVIAGALLHDIGKIEEIEVRGGFRYSDRGRLLGHIALGVIKLKELIGELKDFPVLLEDLLTHIIVSHHGLEEWGSPKRPMFIEAMIVHYLDNLDARIEGVRAHFEEGMEDERWSTYHRIYESRFLRLKEGSPWR